MSTLQLHIEHAEVHALAYHSVARSEFSEAELATLVENAAVKNAALNVGGFLCYNDGVFFQYLEGDPTTLDQLMHSIRVDSRHEITQEFAMGMLPARYFPDWQMRYLNGIDLETGRLDCSALDVLLNLMGPQQPSTTDSVGGVLKRVIDLRKRQQIEDLERSNHELNQFATLAAHDIGAPLRQMVAFVDLLRKEYAPVLAGEGQKYLQFIDTGARQLQQLVADLLRYARLEGPASDPEEVNLFYLMQSVVESQQPEIDNSNAEVRIGDLPVVIGDASGLRQLLTNLLGNALKYRGDRDPVISVDAGIQGPDWLVSVTDNGIGIDEECLAGVFVLLKRGTSDPNYTGNGIGLAICERVVMKHGGRIRVESVRGAGSKFEFTLPRAPANS